MTRHAGRTRLTRLWLLPILLLAFWTHVHLLDGQSMWSDEGLSLYRARQPLGLALANVITVDGVDTRDTNPPLYFLLLGGWRRLTGEAVWTLRYPGALAGILAVPLLYGLTQTLAGSRGERGDRAGLAAALLLAISPFHVWEAQVLRNYSLLILLNLFSVYGLCRYLLSPPGRRRGRWLGLWLGGALAGSLTHYFGFLVMAFGLAALALDAIGKRPTRWRWRLVVPALALSLAVLLPLLATAWDRFRAGRQVDFYPVVLDRVLANAASAFAVGVDPSLTRPWPEVLPALLLALLGLATLWRVGRRPLALALGYLLLPLGLLLALSTINPLYNGTRHLLIGLPPFLILAAVGFTASWTGPRPRRAVLASTSLILGLITVGIQANWLRAQFTSPRLVRDDVRGAAAYLNAYAEPDDVVIVHDTLIRFTFDYYYHGAAEVVSLPRYDQVAPEAAIPALEAATRGAERVWFLADPSPRNGFPPEALPAWADGHWVRVAERAFPGMWLRTGLVLYTPDPRRAALPASAVPVAAEWAAGLRLAGHEPLPPLEAGREWWPALYWANPGGRTDQSTVVFRLVDSAGVTRAEIDDVLDTTYPPALWAPDEIVALRRGLAVPAGLPPGPYDVFARLVDTATGVALPLVDGRNELALGQVEATAAPCAVAGAGPARRMNEAVALAGVDWPDGLARPGHVISLSVLWCVRERPTTNLEARLTLLDPTGALIAEAVAPPTRTDYPATSWEADQLLAGTIRLTVPAAAGAGAYRLRLALIDPTTGQVEGRSLSFAERLVVAPWALVTELPPLARPGRADFGPDAGSILVELHGSDQEPSRVRAGERLEITLVWRAAAEVPASYVVLLHLTDEADTIVAQGDALPDGGVRPTTSWRAGEVIVDRHAIQLPPDLPPGRYRLWTGLYEPETFVRLPAFVDGERQPADRAPLPDVNVTPADFEVAP